MKLVLRGLYCNVVLALFCEREPVKIPFNIGESLYISRLPQVLIRNPGAGRMKMKLHELMKLQFVTYFQYPY